MLKIKVAILIGALAVGGTAVADLNTGLMAYYSFNGNANDESGNGNDGTVNNAVLTIDKAGNSGSAYKFDGDNDSIILPNTAIDGLGDMSFSAWFKLDDSGNSSLISGASAGASNGNEVLFFLPKQGAVTKYIYIKEATYTAKTTVTKGKWYHVIFTRNAVSGQVSLYFNGVLNSTATLPTGNIRVDANGLILGREQDCVGGCFVADEDFNGIIDEVRIYNRILSASEIKQLYYMDFEVEGTVTKMKSLGTICENLTTGESVTIPEKRNVKRWNCESAGLTIKTNDRLKITIKGNSQ